MVSYCLIILVVYTQQISAADFLSKSSQQIFSADLLSIFSADLLSRSFAVVRGWWSAIVLSFAVSFAVVRGWWSAIVLSFWWSILHEFFRRTLSRSFREKCWTLKFPLPLPTDRPANRRFSSLPIKVGPSGEQALEGHAEDDKELDAAAAECRQMKRAKHQPFARLPHPEASSTITSAPLAPAPLGTTPPPSPRIPDTGRSRSPAPGRPRPIGMHPGPPPSEPSSSTGLLRAAKVRSSCEEGPGQSALQSAYHDPFFGHCCARHNDCGSHEDMLNWSSVDNSIAQIGQRTKKSNSKANKTAPTTKPKPTKSDQSMKVRQVKHVYALTTWCIAQNPGSHNLFSSS